MIVEALGLARREIGRPNLQKPDRRCAYMQFVWMIGVTEGSGTVDHEDEASPDLAILQRGITEYSTSTT